MVPIVLEAMLGKVIKEACIGCTVHDAAKGRCAMREWYGVELIYLGLAC